MMPWAVLALFILFLLVAYVMIQGTRAAMAWRKEAAEGNVKVIRDIVSDSIEAWRSMKKPKPVPIEVWRGVQSIELLEAGPDYVRVSCQAESEYRLVDGRWTETRNALQLGMSITARAAEMLFYDLPHWRPQRVQVDLYTNFRQADGASGRFCILSVYTDRDAARAVDWDEWPAEEIISALDGRYEVGPGGQPQPIYVEPVAESAESEVEPEENKGRRTAPQP